MIRARLLLSAAIVVLAPAAGMAQSATWNGNGADWNTGTNWTPSGVPTATATFDATGTANTIVNGVKGSIGAITFSSGVSYTLNISDPAEFLSVGGAGITEPAHSGAPVNHLVLNSNNNSLFFNGSATTNVDLQGTGPNSIIGFYDDSTLNSGTASITNANSSIFFTNTARAINATISMSGANSILTFDNNTSVAGATTITSTAPSAQINFQDSASAGTATVNTPVSAAATINFSNSASAGSATFNLNGTPVNFYNSATASSARFAATNGSVIDFYNTASGGAAAFDLQDALSVLDFSGGSGGVNQAGSITGLGTVYLGQNTVSIGGNNASTLFAGVIADCSGDCAAIPIPLPLSPGRLNKVGSGTLTLTGANTYSGGTVITAGTLQIGNGGTTGSILGNIANSGALIFNRSNNIGYVGVISGSGSVSQTGGGTLTLTAAQTYTGPTTIGAGSTLALEAAGSIAGSALTANGTFNITTVSGSGAGITALAGTGNVVLGAKTLTLSNPSNATFGGVISGTGGLTLTAGHEILTGISTFTGPTTVNGGTLSVNGSTSGSPVTVNNGGTLGGTGTTGPATIQSGGALAPGNSIGTLTVAGNLVFASGSTYRVEVSPTAADKVVATGTASLNGTVAADFAAVSGYTAGRYTIVTSTGALSGTFAGLSTTGLPSGFTASLSYDANNSYLNLLGGDASQGLIHANLAGAYLEDERLIRDAVLDHMITPSGGIQIWGEGFSAFGAVGKTNIMNHNHNGFIAGVDVPLGDGFTLGVAGAWTGYKVTMPSKTSAARGETGHALAYAGWNNLTDSGGWMLKLGGEYGWGAANVARSATSGASSNHQSANTAQIFGEASYRIHFIGADLEPHASLFWVMGQNGAFAETGGINAMSGSAIRQEGTFTRLGVRGLSRWIDLGGVEIAPTLDIGVQLALANPTPGLTVGFATGTPTLLRGNAASGTAGTAQLGLNVRLDDDAAIHFGYDGIFGMAGVDHAVTARLNWNF